MENSKFSLEDFKKIDFSKYLDSDEEKQSEEKNEENIVPKLEIKPEPKKEVKIEPKEKRKKEPKAENELKPKTKVKPKKKTESLVVPETVILDDDSIIEVEDSFEEELPKRNISKPEVNEYITRYTAPKQRGLVARIINRMKYEKGWYEDIEDYIYDSYYDIYDEIEESRTAEKRRDQKLYKRVQAYEDAEDDITMKRAFVVVRVTAAAALLATSAFAVNLLVNEVKDIVNNSAYVAVAKEKSTLANANEGQIAYAQNRAAKIDFDFQHISYDNILDTIIRVGSKVSDITENRARATMKNIGDNADQKLLEEILRYGYEEEYETFSDEKKYELKQLIYEMLDENAQIWIREPAVLRKFQEEKNKEANEMESEK